MKQRSDYNNDNSSTSRMKTTKNKETTITTKKNGNTKHDDNNDAPPKSRSLWNTFWWYGGLPLMLLIYPGLMEQCLRINYRHFGSILITGFGFVPSFDTPTATSTNNNDAGAQVVPPITTTTTTDKKTTNNNNQDQRQQKKKQQQSATTSRGGTNMNSEYDEMIQTMREKIHSYNYDDNFDEQAVNDEPYIFDVIRFAEILRQRDLTYHDGGSVQEEGIQMYLRAIELVQQRRNFIMEREGMEAVSKLPSDRVSIQLQQLLQTYYGGDEFFLQDFTQKSINGLLCYLLTNLSKFYFMANIFEASVNAATEALEYKPNDLDALTSRGGSYNILGQYSSAAADYIQVIRRDGSFSHQKQRYFMEAFTGLTKVLVADEQVVVEALKNDGASNTSITSGWDEMISIIESTIPSLTKEYEQQGSLQQSNQVRTLVDQLKRLHLVLFQYHDAKTSDTQKSWEHLTLAWHYKLSILPPFNKALEEHRIQTTKQIFQPSIFPTFQRSDSQVPIFIIGFVRSGSTLLERILDAHPRIVGTGEDSVFNGRLPKIRDDIVKASSSGNPLEMKQTLEHWANVVTQTMHDRWTKQQDLITKMSIKPDSENDPTINSQPKRFVDKMLTNYMNVGFIHMVFPNALILHVARTPMDTIWSAYKHDFPPGHLDYLSDNVGLSTIYDGYRQMINHWDQVLPGRVTHIRYEDIVNDTPGIAKALIKQCGLEWDDSVLKFHKKKHAVNTLSTNQVRKGIYKNAIEAWKRYETQLQPLMTMVGPQKVQYDELRTTIKGYRPPSEASTCQPA